MPWIRTPRSRTFIEVWYTPSTRRLMLHFRKDETMYAYRGVPDQVFAAFMTAKSMGAFYSRRIRGKYHADLVG